MSSRRLTSSTGDVNSDSTAVVNTLVERDSSGNIAANTVSAAVQLISLGSLVLTSSNKTANFTADTAAFLYTCATGGGSITVTLPAAASSAGLVFAFKKTHASNSLIIDPNASETIDSSATLTATADDAAIIIMCNGSEWHSLSREGTWT